MPLLLHLLVTLAHFRASAIIGIGGALTIAHHNAFAISARCTIFHYYSQWDFAFALLHHLPFLLPMRFCICIIFPNEILHLHYCFTFHFFSQWGFAFALFFPMRFCICIIAPSCIMATNEILQPWLRSLPFARLESECRFCEVNEVDISSSFIIILIIITTIEREAAHHHFTDHNFHRKLPEASIPGNGRAIPL